MAPILLSAAYRLKAKTYFLQSPIEPTRKNHKKKNEKDANEMPSGMTGSYDSADGDMTNGSNHGTNGASGVFLSRRYVRVSCRRKGDVTFTLRERVSQPSVLAPARARTFAVEANVTGVTHKVVEVEVTHSEANASPEILEVNEVQTLNELSSLNVDSNFDGGLLLGRGETYNEDIKDDLSVLDASSDDVSDDILNAGDGFATTHGSSSTSNTSKKVEDSVITNEWFEVDKEASGGLVQFKFNKDRLMMIQSQNESSNLPLDSNGEKDKAAISLDEFMKDGKQIKRCHRYIVEVGLVVSLVETSVGGVSAVNPISGCPCLIAFELS